MPYSTSATGSESSFSPFTHRSDGQQCGHPQNGVSPRLLCKRSTDPALLLPGVHYLPEYPPRPPMLERPFHYTPEAVLSNSVPLGARPSTSCWHRPVEYLDRRPEHRASPLSVIHLSVNETPGPYLSELMLGNTVVDGPNDLVFAQSGCLRASVGFDYPCLLTTPVIRISTVVGPDRRPITRQEFAREVVLSIFTQIKEAKAELQNPLAVKKPKYTQHFGPGQEKWRLDQVKTKRLRLISLNLYGKYWVPILATDA
ncbi:hypothetical protein V5O48_006222 [Marasmius crinis-equi]|uniref:Uncharacterized protein n=1 Tax=Marasmius crinis-equi TaxID=585013 RepID=A0ABR3FK51_9AGAR